MITKNCKKIMAALLCAGNAAFGFIPVTDVNGATVYFAMPYSSQSSGRRFPAQGYLNQLQTGPGAGVQIGTGNTTPTDNDYALEAQITSNVSGQCTYALDTDSNDNPVVTVSVSLTNTGSDSLAISEIGYVVDAACANTKNSSNAYSKMLLLDRTLLDAPVTILPSETKTITYTLSGIWNAGA